MNQLTIIFFGLLAFALMETEVVARHGGGGGGGWGRRCLVVPDGTTTCSSSVSGTSCQDSASLAVSYESLGHNVGRYCMIPGYSNSFILYDTKVVTHYDLVKFHCRQ